MSMSKLFAVVRVSLVCVLMAGVADAAPKWSTTKPGKGNNKPAPAPTEPAPTEPAPTEPTPTEPAPTEPTPTEPTPTPTEPAPTPTDPGGMLMGINVAPVTYYSSEWTFSDAMKMAGGWAQAGPLPRPQWVTTDGNLWPILGDGEVAQSLMYRGIQGKYPTGEYTATWEGDGDVWFGFDAYITQWGTNSLKFKVDWPTDTGVALKINRSNPLNRVRNLKIQVPGAGTGTFDQRYTQNLRPFYVFRFMDWQAINNSQITDWSQRARPEQAMQTYPAGVALEYMLELCNTTGTDPWLCIPHLATDDYIRQFATMVRDKLNAERKVYIEYSNEVWNDSFVQGQWALQQANAQGITRAAFYADHARRVFRIFHEVFGTQKSRVVRVAAGHEAVPWVAEKIMERLNGEADAVSCGGYFYPMDDDAATLNSSTTAADILNMCLRQIREDGVPKIQQHKALADRWSAATGRKIELLIYEGGQHLYTTTDLPWGQAGIDAQKHPLMVDCYRAMLNACKAMDVRVFMAYNSVMMTGRHGAWGAKEHQMQSLTETPKMRTLLEYTTRR